MRYSRAEHGRGIKGAVPVREPPLAEEEGVRHEETDEHVLQAAPQRAAVAAGDGVPPAPLLRRRRVARGEADSVEGGARDGDERSDPRARALRLASHEVELYLDLRLGLEELAPQERGKA